jgi:hypothetical protein
MKNEPLVTGEAQDEKERFAFTIMRFVTLACPIFCTIDKGRGIVK